MSKWTIRSEIILAGFILAGIYAWQATLLWGQQPSSAKTGAVTTYTEQQWRGEGLFLQRCSICHLVRKLKNIGSPPTVGPDLSGVFANIAPDEEKTLRAVILKGSPNMPGFEYALDPKEMNDLVAYLKAKK